jgi:hypothetical protein
MSIQAILGKIDALPPMLSRITLMEPPMIGLMAPFWGGHDRPNGAGS